MKIPPTIVAIAQHVPPSCSASASSFLACPAEAAALGATSFGELEPELAVVDAMLSAGFVGPNKASGGGPQVLQSSRSGSDSTLVGWVAMMDEEPEVETAVELEAFEAVDELGVFRRGRYQTSPSQVTFCGLL